MATTAKSRNRQTLQLPAKVPQATFCDLNPSLALSQGSLRCRNKRFHQLRSKMSAFHSTKGICSKYSASILHFVANCSYTWCWKCIYHCSRRAHCKLTLRMLTLVKYIIITTSLHRLRKKDMASRRQRILLHGAFNVFTFNIPELNGKVCLLSWMSKAINMILGKCRDDLIYKSWVLKLFSCRTLVMVDVYRNTMNHDLNLFTTKRLI